MRRRIVYGGVVLLLVAGFVLSLVTGKYPLTLTDLLSGDETSLQVFWNLRFARSVMAMVAGFGLAMTGYVFQTVFQNPIASPDIMGVSSGACVGAGVAIVFLDAYSGATALFAFFGGILAVMLSMTFARLSPESKLATFVLSGVAVNALAEALLMLIKMTADPLGKLAMLEFWTMGSFATVTAKDTYLTLPMVLLSSVGLLLMYRQITLLALDGEDAKMLGVSVAKVRCIVIVLATLVVSIIVSNVGRISFIGLIAPHIMRLLTRTHSVGSMFFSGLLGGAIILFADSLARSLGSAEIPISILTSLIGAPILICLVLKGGKMS
ncbi:MAG: iron ABC transporter permease [Eubacteriales bacterium]